MRRAGIPVACNPAELSCALTAVAAATVLRAGPHSPTPQRRDAAASLKLALARLVPFVDVHSAASRCCGLIEATPVRLTHHTARSTPQRRDAADSLKRHVRVQKGTACRPSVLFRCSSSCLCAPSPRLFIHDGADTGINVAEGHLLSL